MTWFLKLPYAIAFFWKVDTINGIQEESYKYKMNHGHKSEKLFH